MSALQTAPTPMQAGAVVTKAVVRAAAKLGVTARVLAATSDRSTPSACVSSHHRSQGADSAILRRSTT